MPSEIIPPTKALALTMSNIRIREKYEAIFPKDERALLKQFFHLAKGSSVTSLGSFLLSSIAFFPQFAAAGFF